MNMNRKLKCTKQLNSVRKAYSDLMGKPFFKPPDYKLYNMEDPNKKEKHPKNTKKKVVNKNTRKRYSRPQNYNGRNARTRKYTTTRQTRRR
jgi:hypothetical protein